MVIIKEPYKRLRIRHPELVSVSVPLWHRPRSFVRGLFANCIFKDRLTIYFVLLLPDEFSSPIPEALYQDRFQ